MSKNSADSWGWFNIIETSGQDAVTSLPPYLIGWRVWSAKVTKAKGTKKVPWYWAEVHQKAFDDVKATIAKEVVLAYLNFDKVFEIYTNAPTKQLGSVITQSNRPLAFFSRKLSVRQQK